MNDNQVADARILRRFVISDLGSASAKSGYLAREGDHVGKLCLFLLVLAQKIRKLKLFRLDFVERVELIVHGVAQILFGVLEPHVEL